MTPEAASGDAGREINALLARITDPDPLTRLDAAQRLGQLRQAAGGPALLNALSDQEWRVRAAAAEGLGRLGALQAMVALCQRLDDPKTEVRRAAAYALDALGAHEATASLIMALEREQDPEARRLMIRALGNVGDDRALRPLLHLCGDKHWAVRREASAAASRLKERRNT